MKNSNKKRVAILFGGKSAEHEVSVQSASNIIEAIDKEKYELVLIGIDHQGSWFLYDENCFVEGKICDPDNLGEKGSELAVIPGDTEKYIYDIEKNKLLDEIDVIFPVLHGPFGEDGTIQGMLKIMDIPFVGAGVLGSALGMDKDIMKRLLRDKGINIADYMIFTPESEIRTDEIIDKLGSPLFVKPANLGSSVGVRKVLNEKEIEDALQDAFQYDNKAIVEEFVAGREIECSVLGNGNPMASVPGEVLPQGDFYSYEAKYIDEKGAVLDIPAKLPEDMVDKIQRYAIAAFKVLCCEGMARVDFFMQEDGHLIINEINTIPGFTRISMYPKLWEMSGVPYPELIDRLIQLAIDRYERESKLKTSL